MKCRPLAWLAVFVSAVTPTWAGAQSIPMDERPLLIVCSMAKRGSLELVDADRVAFLFRSGITLGKNLAIETVDRSALLLGVKVDQAQVLGGSLALSGAGLVAKPLVTLHYKGADGQGGILATIGMMDDPPEVEARIGRCLQFRDREALTFFDELRDAAIQRESSSQ